MQLLMWNFFLHRSLQYFSMEDSLLTIHQLGFALEMEIISPWTQAGPVSSTLGVVKFHLLLEDTKLGRKSIIC